MNKITKLAALFVLAALPSGLLAADASMFAPATSGRAFDMICGPQGIMAGMPGCGEPGLFSAMFTIFNAGIMAVAALWFAWTAMAAVAQTAHDGEFLGKRFSSLWMPIRVVVGATAIVPIVNGFNLAQIVMMWGALTGITIADNTWSAVVGGLGKGVFAVGEQHPQATAKAESMNNMLRLLTCVKGLDADGKVDGEQLFTGYVYVSGAGTKYEFGKLESGRRMPICGTMTAKTAAEASAVYSIANSKLGPIAERIVMGETAIDTGSAVKVALGDYQKFLDERLKAAIAANGTDKVLDRLQDPGRWIEAGAWYQTVSTISRQNAAQAEPTVAVAMNPAIDSFLSGVTGSTTAAAMDSLEIKQADNSPKDGMQKAFESMKDGNGWWSTAGQELTSGFVSWLNDGGSKNPMLVVKDAGDYMIVSGEAILTAYSAAVVAVKGASAGWITQAADQLTSAGLFSKAGALAALLELSDKWVSALVAFLIMTGGILAVYIPFVPFIQWIAAVIQYLIILIEAMVSAPLWAMVHMDSDGEGLGQRTTYGYLFLLNVLFRPVLMIFGFIGAGVILYLAGGLVNDLFAFAVFNANTGGDGQATFGLVSFCFVVAVYVSIMLMLVNGTFNLVHILPDKVLNWVGGQFHYSQSPDPRHDFEKISSGMNVQGRPGAGAGGALQNRAKSIREQLDRSKDKEVAAVKRGGGNDGFK
ncbi:MAG TPA: DotA/TraY family protein [Thiobacillus sp.]|nr:DotA/TraY family protein [Thiobacillus sp.]